MGSTPLLKTLTSRSSCPVPSPSRGSKLRVGRSFISLQVLWASVVVVVVVLAMVLLMVVVLVLLLLLLLLLLLVVVLQVLLQVPAEGTLGGPPTPPGVCGVWGV